MRGLLTLLLFVTSAWSKAWYEKGSKHGIVEELGPLLSEYAKIVLPDDVRFKDASHRWQWWDAPDVKAVVEVQSEEDVRQTILFANKYDVPFFARSGGHGAVSSLGKVKRGIQISMHNLNSISVSQDGTYAMLGGGIYGKEVIDALWKVGKQTVTGMCECVGLTAVVLGGGHGILQGSYGVLSDQMISVRLVLANGTSITVSNTEHADLFWALQGAGHNYGIVTSLDYRIYDVDLANKKDVWSYEMFTFTATEENVRSIYGQANSMLDTQPEGLMMYGLVMTNPDVSKEPIILHHVIWNGPLSTIKSHTQAFYNMNPISVANEEGTYLDVARFLQIDEASPVCHADEFIPGAGLVRVPADFRDYDIDAMVAAVNKFTEVTTTIPEFAASFFMIEQYPTRGLSKREPKSSAFPSREDRLLLAPAFYYASMNVETGKPNKTLDDLAIEKGLEIKKFLAEGAKKNGGTRAYVNYAYGGEMMEEMYGEEKWRLEKLRRLKREYDPENRFGYYAPIEPADVKDGHDEL